jgi:hypothetical protein
MTAGAMTVSKAVCSGSRCSVSAFSSVSPTPQQVFEIPNGTVVKMVCWLDAAWWTGRYRSNRWFKVSMVYGDGRQYLHSSNVDPQTKVGHC